MYKGSNYAWRSQDETQSNELSLRERREELRMAALTDGFYSLQSPTAGHELIAAIRPVFWDWLEWRHGALTYRLTQVLTGHGCFGKYLCRIGRELTEECHHCEAPEDDAMHTLLVCPAWANNRRDLVAKIGEPALSLTDVISAMVRSECAWQAVADYCENTMATKEAAERVRESSSDIPSRRRRPRRQRQNDLRPP
ncbi:uncharacterized protein LOC113505758 [Trichoplusia ni]|uniref:Uncharacterized protein LOC113505758 n=1 Tax=Trichoplusia ni TaxID=7111 RepID=A0A7E5WV02_TRINI|nr:uncharacterized protein LOC113505758 [Trichoplusia ni]